MPCSTYTSKAMHPSSTTSSEAPRDSPAKHRGTDPADHHGLIDGGHPPSTARTRRLYLVVIFAFLGPLIAAGLVDTFWPITPPTPVGEENEVQQAQQQAARWHDGSLAQWIEEQSRQRSRVRHEVLPAYSQFLLVGLGHVQQQLILGRQDWLFLRSRATPSLGSDEAHLSQSTAVLSALQRRSRQAGFRLVVLPIPRKSSLAAEFLPPDIDSRAHLDERLPGRLAAAGIDHVDILPRLRRLEETWDETPYYRGDSHLTRSAMLEAAEQVAQHLDLWTPPTERRRTTLRHLGPRLARKDLMRLAGIDIGTSSANAALVERRLDFEVLDSQGRRAKPAEKGSVAIVGSSYSAYSDFALYLTHFIDQPVVDLSKPGQNPLEAVAGLLAAPPASVPAPVILMEIPNYFLFDSRQRPTSS